MIFGEYPCCGGNLAISLAEGALPQWQRGNCPHCGAVVWHRHSRIDPHTVTEDLFLEENEVDEAKMVLSRKPEQRQ